MRVVAGNGVEVHSQGDVLCLDPKRTTPGSVVTHGHTDHLTADAYMTPPTVGFLKIRKPTRSALPLPYGTQAQVAGFRVRLHDAGHIFGSAMVEVEAPEGSLVYTGDFNPRAGFTTGRAVPRACDTLVMESTYGDPRFDLPPRDMVVESIEAWMLGRMLKGPVAMGAYPLGRAQELVALANRAGLTPIVSPDIGAFTAVYNAHGHDLAYAVAGTERARDLAAQGGLHIVPRDWLKKGHDFARGLRSRDGAAAYLSGWCHRYSYFNAYDIDAQFALSDHASFHDLVAFALETKAKKVYTMHGAAGVLARELRTRGVKAEALAEHVPVARQSKL
ncbi:MAG TPA: hypothetical protein VM370_07275 [Candidatus Thermoplasmatota archaeon]|nr:hypothetical protein [Candidatus Thermoplasmatota archaeon]